MKIHQEEYCGLVITIYDARSLYFFSIETESYKHVHSSGYFRLFSDALDVAHRAAFAESLAA